MRTMPARAGACLLGALLAGCAAEGTRPVYGLESRLLDRIDYDTDRNGTVEARLFFGEGRPVRLEVDADTDGRVERWELYRGDGTLDRLGTSSLADGRADTWVVQAEDGMTVEMSTRRDGVLDRREVHEGGLLLQTEMDSNYDGRPDQWQRFDGGRLVELGFDTTLATGKPDRRLIYRMDGTVARVEADTEGDGRFTEVPDADR